MSGVTNQLLEYCYAVNDLVSDESRAEADHVASSGEQITSGLLALELQRIGVPARAWAGWQLPLRSDGMYTKASIGEISTDAVLQSLAEGKVAVVAGFQGVSPEGRITTLGRGGSDTSAVALAAAFKAERCDIYTDVDGVYTSDPRIVTKAKKLDKVSYEEMLEMASLGSKVLQTRSVELAMNYRVKLVVRSTFADTVPGTEIVDEEEIMETQRVTGLAYSRDEARITLTNVENKPGVSASIFGPLADRGINVDMIVQNVTEDGKSTDLTFTVTKGDLTRALEIVKGPNMPKYEKVHTDGGVAKISVIGVGMRSHAGVAADMFKTLAEKNINIIVISTSEIKISVLIDESYIELALRALHTAYGLDAQEEKN
jgi:aspartate kinase